MVFALFYSDLQYNTWFAFTLYVYSLKASFVSKSVYNILIHTTLTRQDEQLIQINASSTTKQ